MSAVDDLAEYCESCVGDVAAEPYLAVIAELEDIIERLKGCGNCGIASEGWPVYCQWNYLEEDGISETKIVSLRDSCHFTTSRWAERGT